MVDVGFKLNGNLCNHVELQTISSLALMPLLSEGVISALSANDEGEVIV